VFANSLYACCLSCLALEPHHQLGCTHKQLDWQDVKRLAGAAEMLGCAASSLLTVTCLA